MRAALLTLLTTLALGLVACGDNEGLSEEDVVGQDGAGTAAASSCAQVEAPEPKQVDLEKPSGGPPPAGSRVVVATSCGDFTIALDVKGSPKTTASFAHLAEQGAFDGTPFHRVAPGFVIQGGDPSGDGTGGPGYSVTERPPAGTSYTRGVVAMAKSDAEPPGTSGSQFFVVTGAEAPLPPEFAVVGEVRDGFDTVEAIESLGASGSDGPPSQPVVIESATLEEG